MIIISILDITSKCNLNCVYCCRGNKDRVECEPSSLEVLYAIQQVIAARGDLLVLQGGEPLMRPDIIQLLDKIAELKSNSNGNLNNELKKLLLMMEDVKHFSCAYKRMLIKLGLPLVCVTTNGMFYSDGLMSILWTKKVERLC